MTTQPEDRLAAALDAPNASVRLQAALSAGTYPRSPYVEVLIDRCAVEGDFFVRDMLTWALMRHPADLTVPRLIEATTAEAAQSRSQALHTLSKIGDPRGWSAVTRALLRDADDRVARAAWRAAVILAPVESREELAGAMVGQLGRGDSETQLSLSRALAELGEWATPALRAAADYPDGAVRAHARAIERLIADSEAAAGE
ncbi:HEAT repeat domain-containing protein [Agreia sp. COWG]|uniref:HEAT repeat domain-containing protein n=1 Tax=Agreia sp. COWG TaxID=2773266 RepID=UPI0019295708|nr:HEAT repeat domain-containing protein [Agreia sp. COWG]CAD5997170.1 conserved protein of unknown function [Agreia sp. COWG]